MSEQLEEDFIFKKHVFVHGVCVCALTYVPVDLPMCLTVYRAPPWFWEQGLSLNLELTILARLASE